VIWKVCDRSFLGLGEDKKGLDGKSMMKLQTITLLLIVLLCSCKDKEAKDYENLILGEWNFVRIPLSIQYHSDGTIIPPPPMHGNILEGYTFLPDSICEVKLGYFKSIEIEGERARQFLGTRTKYFIKNDSLKIFNLKDSIWDVFKISSITADTLIFQRDDSTFETYAKPHYNYDTTTIFDRLIVSSSGCYGSCPAGNISISKSGEVIYLGEYYNTVNGLFKSQIDSATFSKLVTPFKKLQIGELNEKYAALWTDDEKISVTFIKDNKIVKTIEDYGHKAPAEFFWACTPLRYLYLTIPLDTFKIPFGEIPRYSSFEFNGQEYDLPKSESFYLWHLLSSSVETQQKFSKKYSLISSERSIKTDGRYYKMALKNGNSVTYDLGFDFIAQNNLTKKFRPKRKRD